MSKTQRPTADIVQDLRNNTLDVLALEAADRLEALDPPGDELERDPELQYEWY